jgi:hypothetical protein
VSLWDEIFPRRRHPNFVQTEWSRGWGYGSIGFAEAARFLTEHQARFHASIDQVGLVVFYLQRHRVELALKALLVAHKVDLSRIKPPHSLRALWDACGTAISAVDKQSWDYLDSAGTELTSVLDAVDPDSAAFRYPENRKGEEHERPKFIDLAALEKHVDTFSAAISGYTAYSYEMQQFEAEEYRELQQELRQEYGDDYGHGQ